MAVDPSIASLFEAELSFLLVEQNTLLYVMVLT